MFHSFKVLGLQDSKFIYFIYKAFAKAECPMPLSFYEGLFVHRGVHCSAFDRIGSGQVSTKFKLNRQRNRYIPVYGEVVKV